jgi:RES domain
MIPAPPSPFPEINRETVRVGAELHRVHAAGTDSNGFNPCTGRPSRFAPLVQPDGTCIPTAYAASTFECAVHETVFHEIQHDAPRKSIGFHVIAELDYAILRTRRSLLLAALFEPDLNKWGVTRRNLIDTFAADYGTTARWAFALHNADPAIEGLVWTSRRCDPDRAYVLFGDRVRPEDLDVVRRERIAHSTSLLLQVREFGSRAGIFIAF